MKNLMAFSASVQDAFNGDSEKFNAFNKLMLDNVHGRFDMVTKQESNDKIREKLLMSIGCTTDSTKQEIRKALRRNRVEFFEIIEETLENILVSGWDNNPFFKEYVETRNLALGDTNVFHSEDESVLTVAKLAPGHHDIIRQRVGSGKSFAVDTEYIGLKVYAEMERILTGVEDFSNLIKKVAQAIDMYVNQALYDALSGIDNLGAQWMKNSALNAGTANDLRTLITDVQMATGYDVAILGTKAALASVYALQNVDWVSDNMKDEKYTTGRLAYFEGTPLIELSQRFALNDTTKYLVDNRKLFIMPKTDNKFIKLVYEGSPEVYEITDPVVRRDMTSEYEYMMRLGVSVITNLKFGIWTLV